MPTYTVKAPDVERLLRAHADRYPEAIQKGAMVAAQRARTQLVRTSPVDTGIYKNAWRVVGLGKGLNRGLTLQNDAPHAGIIEMGARPHPVSREGVEAITQWVKRHIHPSGPAQKMVVEGPVRQGGRRRKVHVAMSLSDEQAKAIAWAIVGKIKKYGQKPTYHVLNNFHLLQLIFMEETRRAIDKVLAKGKQP